MDPCRWWRQGKICALREIQNGATFPVPNQGGGVGVYSLFVRLFITLIWPHHHDHSSIPSKFRYSNSQSPLSASAYLYLYALLSRGGPIRCWTDTHLDAKYPEIRERQRHSEDVPEMRRVELPSGCLPFYLSCKKNSALPLSGRTSCVAKAFLYYPYLALFFPL